MPVSFQAGLDKLAAFRDRQQKMVAGLADLTNIPPQPDERRLFEIPEDRSRKRAAGWTWRELTTPEALDQEGDRMGHWWGAGSSTPLWVPDAPASCRYAIRAGTPMSPSS